MPKNTERIKFPVIVAAVGGDLDAVTAVLKRYENYIIQLSTKKLYDGNGNAYTVVDEEMRRRLETKLITKILQFNPA